VSKFSIIFSFESKIPSDLTTAPPPYLEYIVATYFKSVHGIHDILALIEATLPALIALSIISISKGSSNSTSDSIMSNHTYSSKL